MTLRVVISGASSGLGLALTRHYLAQGAAVAVIARRAELLQPLLLQFPQQIYCYPLDVCDATAMQAAAHDFIVRAGVPDIVIANAGVSVGTLTEYAEDIDAFQQVMNINVLGVVKTFQPFLRAMRKAALTCSARSGWQAGTAQRAQSMLCEFPASPPNPSDKTTSHSTRLSNNASQVAGYPASGRGGRFTLVGIASVAGLRGLPGGGAYSASKAALISYLESLRVELHGSGVRVVTICPGYIKTPMTSVNPYPMPFILEADAAARRIARAIESGKSFAVVPWQMGLVGRVLKLLPNWLYDRLFTRAPRKPRRFI